MKNTPGRQRTRMKLVGFVVTILCVMSARPDTAPAQTRPSSQEYERRAAAEALFDEAKALMSAQRFTEACPKFAASQAMDPAVGTMLNLGDCLEKLGRTASAWAEFRAAAAAARTKGQTERAEVARKRADAIEPRLVRLSVIVPDGTSENVDVRKNGTSLTRGSWGVALPVDPGRYVIDALVSGKQVYHTEVDVPDKPGNIITLVIPRLSDSTLTRRQVQRGLTITFGALSIASLVTGGVLGAAAIARQSQSAGHCIEGNLCDATGVSYRQDALALGNGSTALFATGAALGIGTLILHLTTPPNIPPTKIGFGATSSGAGLIVGGAF